MADNKSLRGKPDRMRIAAQQPHELRFWARKWRVPEWVIALLRSSLSKQGLALTVENYVAEIETHKASVKRVRSIARKARK